MNSYDKGDVVRCRGAFTNNLDAPIDPTNIFFKLEDPTGTQITKQYGVDIAVIREGVGSYYYDVDADIEGYYRYRFSSTGTGKAADDQRFVVDPTVF